MEYAVIGKLKDGLSFKLVYTTNGRVLFARDIVDTIGESEYNKYKLFRLYVSCGSSFTGLFDAWDKL